MWSIPITSPVIRRVVENALAQTEYTVSYDPSYVKLAYPGGDVPLETGVCTDVIVRAFRAGGVDLQKEIHEDMTRNFSAYPQLWQMTRPDANIDHRRVQNQMTFFQRKGAALSLSDKPADYAPGDVVAWDLGSTTHVGIVTNIRAAATENLQIVHNVGAGARLADVLFAWRIIGHYRYFK